MSGTFTLDELADHLKGIALNGSPPWITVHVCNHAIRRGSWVICSRCGGEGGAGEYTFYCPESVYDKLNELVAGGADR